MFDGELSTYPSIIHMIRSADDNPQVTQIQLRVNSPGGYLDGLFDLLNVIKSVSKPVESLIEVRADSAAYGIVSQTDRIIALSDMSEVGSVGVVTSFFVDEEIIDISSSDAPKKWPDVTTEKGVDVVRAELDEIHQKFVEIIADGRAAATGRRVTVADVNSNFGQGGTMLAEAGLSAGMIDEIIPAPERVSNADFFQNNTGSAPSSSRSGKIEPRNKMDLKELKEKYPEVYKAVIKTERDETAALLKMGKTCGKMDYAVECVEQGKRLGNPLVQAEFLSARINKNDADTRDGDNPPDLNPPPDNAEKFDEADFTKKYLEKRKRRHS
jgi:hypothetical protein